MRRVTGIGGVFIRAKNPEVLAGWYSRHLGLQLEPWGGSVLRWSDPERPEPDGGVTVWSMFPQETDYFGRPEQQVMINYRVEDLEALLVALREEGCLVDEKVDVSELGKFGWVTDPEGNRVELWQPPGRRL